MIVLEVSAAVIVVCDCQEDVAVWINSPQNHWPLRDDEDQSNMTMHMDFWHDEVDEVELWIEVSVWREHYLDHLIWVPTKGPTVVHVMLLETMELQDVPKFLDPTWDPSVADSNVDDDWEDIVADGGAEDEP